MKAPDKFAGFKKKVDGILTDFLDGVKEDLEAEASGAGESIEKLRWIIQTGGKRIRPIFCILGNALTGGEQNDRILKVAASLELLHTFAIVHDDVMDQSTTRRGIKTLFGEPDAKGMNSGMATLIGDLAFVLSETLFSSSGFESELLQKARSHLDRMRLHAVGGQYLDLAMSGKPTEDVEVGRSIARMKTGSYTVEGPLLIGASLAEADSSLENALAGYGRMVGEAFQHHDDLTILGDPALLGKDPLADLRQGRPLALIAETFSRSGDKDRDTLQRLWGEASATASDLVTVNRIIVESGAEDAMRKTIKELIHAAIESLRSVDGRGLSSEASEAYRALKELPEKLLTM